MQIRVPEAAILEHGKTILFEYPSPYGNQQGFILRYGNGFHAYRNKCQHWPIPLDYGESEFFYADVDRILCKTHGAQYHPATGECDAGPCQKAALERFHLEFEGADALITVPDL